MSGAAPPYLYDPPSARRTIAFPYSDFNPRAATQAHHEQLAQRAERHRQKALQDGKPLINFNAHPDSYMIVGGPGLQYEPMPANTKVVIAVARWFQLALRIIQEIGALGLLVCFICLKMKLDGQGWVLRIAPAWDSVVCLYAVYHLIRPARGRTPVNSGSYHFFSLFMDTGIIPFYVFIVLLANQNYNEQPGSTDRWTSMFTNEHTTTLLIFTAFIGAIVMSGLHLVSIGLDLYLIVMFRRIARLPPDMNPLEDNLTRRVSSRKHKHKNSEMTAVATTTPSGQSDDSEKKKSAYWSGSTMISDADCARLSSSSTAKEPQARTIPFGHSRVDSNAMFSPHNPDSARLSRQQFEAAGLYPPSTNARPTTARPRHESPARYARGTSKREESGYHAAAATEQEERRVPHQQGNPLTPDNWFVFEDDDHEVDMGSVRARHDVAAPAYSQLPMHERHDSAFEPVTATVVGQYLSEPDPLKMNPPTPVPPPVAGDDSDDEDRAHRDLTPRAIPPRQQSYTPYEPLSAAENSYGQDDSQHHREVSASSTLHHAPSSVYSDDAPTIRSGARISPGTPKGKYYGDLAAATRGVRGGGSSSPFMQHQQQQQQQYHSQLQQRPGAFRAETTIGGYSEPSAPAPMMNGRISPGKKTRVISRTGVDITDINRPDAFHHYPNPRRREVSGKVAEEGRGGW